MALPFSITHHPNPNHIVSIDLGARTTKAVHLQRKGQSYQLSAFTVQEAPIYEKSLPAEVLGDHLREVVQALGARVKPVILALGVGDSLLRHAEVPAIPIPDVRLMLKYNTKTYLQQDLPDYVFDCHVLPARTGAAAGEPPSSKKMKVIVGGARQQLLTDVQTAAKGAGLTADQIVPNLVGASNAFELAEPEVFKNEVVALLDLGFKNSTVSILMQGELALSRVVGIGGDRLTSGLADTLSISYAEAEGLKVGLAEEVQAIMQTLLMPLGREFRASIDFFEHQHDRTVGQVFVSGGAARSAFIVEMLQQELMVPCRTWNPAQFLELALPPQQMGEMEETAPLLTVAIGAAFASFA